MDSLWLEKLDKRQLKGSFRICSDSKYRSLIRHEELLDKVAYSHRLDLRGSFRGLLPPRQMKVIPGCRSKTPVAQMHFASEHLMAKGRHGINGS